MEPSLLRNKAIRRIYRDLQEIQNNPIEGVGVCIPNDNEPFELRANILILDDLYKGIMLHTIILIPENYPVKPPRMIIAPNQNFSNRFHHHIFDDDSTGGKNICIDLLDNGFHFAKENKTDWTPAYAFHSFDANASFLFKRS